MPEVKLTARENGPWMVPGPAECVMAEAHETLAGENGVPVPLRRVEQETVLRWGSPQDRVRGSPRRARLKHVRQAPDLRDLRDFRGLARRRFP
jgi:hypothetical protein